MTNLPDHLTEQKTRLTFERGKLKDGDVKYCRIYEGDPVTSHEEVIYPGSATNLKARTDIHRRALASGRNFGTIHTAVARSPRRCHWKVHWH